MRHLAALLLLACALLAFSAAGCAEETPSALISEVMASNGTWTNGHAYDWVEIRNVSGKALDLSGWHLSDSKKNPAKWTFPAGTRLKKNGYLVVYCTGSDMDPGSDGVFYSSFKLSADGDQVLLSDASGALVQMLEFPRQYGNISWGTPDAGATWGYFEEATPGKANGKAVFSARCAAPALLTSGGFYSGSVTVQAACSEGDTLRYTTDGSTPTARAKVFPADGLTVKATTALRIRAFREDAVPSAPVSATYLVDDPFPVATVCLTTDEKYLFHSKTGALVKGTGSIPNYDKELEYPVHIEYFDAQGSCLISQMGSFTASGHSARQNAQKSIAIYARKAYGPEFFSFNPFPNRPYTQYKSLLLRAANSDWHATRLRDPAISSLAEGLDLIYQDALPIVVFINGEYWGHYNLREKINKYFVAQWEGISLSDDDTVDAIDILARTGSDRYVQNGSNADWLELCEFCKTRDLNAEENLAFVTDRLDVDSLFTHAAFEIIIGNTDITNVRMYRVPGGKWKYLLFDVEAGFGSSSDKNTSPLEYYIKDLGSKIQAFRHEPLNALLKVPAMRERFLTRFAQVLEHSFQWPYVKAHFQPWEDIVETLLPRHIQRWRNMKLSDWRKNITATEYYARVRPKKAVDMLARRMKLTQEEVETYFGQVQRLLEEVNAAP